MEHVLCWGPKLELKYYTELTGVPNHLHLEHVLCWGAKLEL